MRCFRIRHQVLAAVSVLCAFSVERASALTLEESIASALKTNPQIGQAIENRRATEWELRQARGLFLPRVDVEASTGARELDSPARRAAGLVGSTLYPQEVGAVLQQSLVNLGSRSEIEYQASRVDGASLRVLERSENIALQVALAYHEILLKETAIRLARENIAFHDMLLADIRRGTSGGTLTIADQRQGEERALAARSKLVEANEELEAARIKYIRLVGQQPGMTSPVRSLAGSIPPDINQAVATLAQRNPTIRLADADIDSAQSLVGKARADFWPTLGLELRARTGHDIDGVEDKTNDAQALIVFRWQLYNGVRDANIQEQIRRVGEEWMRFYDARNSIEEELRTAYSRRNEQVNLLSFLEPQLAANRDVVQAYRDQFTVGRRSLLDLLNAQNTYYSVQILVETARSAISFAEYRIVSADGRLLATLNQTPPEESDAIARINATVPAKPAYDTIERKAPPPLDGNGRGYFGKL
jgi:outer membrane protein, adhesin transport system